MKNLIFSISIFGLLSFAASTVMAQDLEPAPIEEQGYFDGIIVPNEVWDGSFAFGLNGKSGNSTNLDINLDMTLEKETDIALTKILMNYFYSSNQLGTAADRFFTEARRERKLANPMYSWYYTGSFEWDRFKAFDYRVALHTGIGITLFDTGVHSLKTRIGAGASREFGGANDEWLPELALGADWERQLTERTNLFINVDYFPNLEDFSDFRLNTRAGLETLLDPALDMKLRMFVFNRYDSTPGVGFQESDIEYGVSLVFGF